MVARHGRERSDLGCHLVREEAHGRELCDAADDVVTHAYDHAVDVDHDEIDLGPSGRADVDLVVVVLLVEQVGPYFDDLARELVAGVRRNRAELDRRIAESAANWALDRMAVTDRCVLRLGAYEIFYGDTPNTVAIDEAIELARRFGTAQSAQFVNGVLDRLLHQDN